MEEAVCKKNPAQNWM